MTGELKMTEKKINTRIQQKHDIEANWLKATSFKPAAGEFIVYDPDDTHSSPRFKIGDGITKVNDLPFGTEYVLQKGESITSLSDISVFNNKKVRFTALVDSFYASGVTDYNITFSDGSRLGQIAYDKITPFWGYEKADGTVITLFTSESRTYSTYTKQADYIEVDFTGLTAVEGSSIGYIVDEETYNEDTPVLANAVAIEVPEVSIGLDDLYTNKADIYTTPGILTLADTLNNFTQTNGPAYGPTICGRIANSNSGFTLHSIDRSGSVSLCYCLNLNDLYNYTTVYVPGGSKASSWEFVNGMEMPGLITWDLSAFSAEYITNITLDDLNAAFTVSEPTIVDCEYNYKNKADIYKRSAL
jgi:hypothetical protein